ncbi:MAG: nitronate monooxygenase [Deltaproteobacteria bacterium]|nr:nitronate monooxygenase [Candidatus Zymogenaceae bacterium]
MFTTRITKLLNIRYPILMGAMHHITEAHMVASVANAGCIGFIPAASFSGPQHLRQELEKARGLTDGPIGLNISMLPGADSGALTDEFVEVGIEAGVGAFETAGRSPDHLIDRIKKAHIPLIHKVPRVRYALRAESLGVDAVTILGFEGGGFVGAGDVGSFVLVNRAARSLSIPVIAGGGVADGEGLVAMLGLGAEGVLMGTRFMASREATIPDRLKQWIVDANENDTTVIFKSLGTPVRSIRNEAALKVSSMEADGATMAQILSFAGERVGAHGVRTFPTDEVLFSVGQDVGLIENVKTIREIVDDIVHEAGKVLGRLNSIIGR